MLLLVGTLLHIQDCLYPSMHTSYYKFSSSEPGNYSYYDQSHAYEVNGHGQGYYENRRPLVSSPVMTHQQPSATSVEWGGGTNVNSPDTIAECK